MAIAIPSWFGSQRNQPPPPLPPPSLPSRGWGAGAGNAPAGVGNIPYSGFEILEGKRTMPTLPSIRTQQLHQRYPDLNIDDLTFLVNLETDETGTIVPTWGNQTLDWIARNIASQHFTPLQYASFTRKPMTGDVTELGKHSVGMVNPADYSMTYKTQYTFPWDFYHLTQQQYQKEGQRAPSWLEMYKPTPERPRGGGALGFSVASILASQKETEARKRRELEERLRQEAAEKARAMQKAPTRPRIPSTWAYAPAARWLTY